MRICIIGGGPAGLFTAITAKEKNPLAEVVLLEKSNQLLSKVRISGGGRCNVTHACFDPTKLIHYYPRGSKELLGPFQRFQPKDTVAWFEERGVSLKTEGDGRMFPVSDSSETIVNCLLQTAEKVGVEIRKLQRIELIERSDGGFLVDGQFVDRLVLATGSAPWGHEVARHLGHTIIDPVPSLFTFNVPTSPLLDLSGIAVPEVVLTIKETKQQQRGPLLLTHWGFSGPAALKLSAWAARELHARDYKATLVINWTLHENQELLYQHLLKIREEQTVLPPLLPMNLLRRLVASVNCDLSVPLKRWKETALRRLAAKLQSDAYSIEGKTTYKQEFVTAGGIHLKEVDFKRMESRLVPGLFFVGEILNIDGVTGGFNFQNCWTSGFIAGSAL